MSPDRRDAFDVLVGVYAAALIAPVVGEYTDFLVYLGVFVGVFLVVYSGSSEAESLPARVVYIFGEAVAETPVRSPYVYLGLWNVLVGLAVVAVARRTA